MGKSSTPRRKRLNKQGRINSGKNWILEYSGKNIVKGYANWYGVNLLCAIQELREIGIEIPTEYEESVKRSIKDRNQKRYEKKLIEQNLHSEWDNEFEFIAGYTSNGVPFGIEKEQPEGRSTKP